MSCWIKLGIEPTKDQDIIRGAYRARLPEFHPETDPEGFQVLRAAYEHALKLATSDDDEDDADDAVPARTRPQRVHPVIATFARMLADPARRYNVNAWQDYIRELDQLPLEELEDISWDLLWRLEETRPLSNTCVNVLAKRLAWDQQLLRLGYEEAREVENLLARFAQPDPFDSGLMNQWSTAAQLETQWYLHTLLHLYEQRPLFELAAFAREHTVIALPQDATFVESLLLKFSQAGVASPSLYALCLERQAQQPDDVDLLYLLTHQASLLGKEEEALSGWTRLWLEHQHPQAARELLTLCRTHQPQRLPLMVQAFDRLAPVRSWPDDLSEDAQTLGSPSQRPETLSRWFEVVRLELDGIAGLFAEWRATDTQELELLASLIDEHPDPPLQRLYRHAWALHCGDSALLQQVLDEPHNSNLIDELILQGFRYQAEQQLAWLQQAPIPLAIQAFVTSHSAQPQLPAALKDGATTLCRDWLRRLRPYNARMLARIKDTFSPRAMMPVPFGLEMQCTLAAEGLVLPPAPDAAELWHWHRQALFMLALAQDPQRWLKLVTPSMLDTLQCPSGHPLAKVHTLLLNLLQEQGNLEGLLGWLDNRDPLQKLIADSLPAPDQALSSARLPSTEALLASYHKDEEAFADDLLGMMLFWAVLYHDPALNAEQHRVLLRTMADISSEEPWFEAFRSGLIKGEPSKPPREKLDAYGMDSAVFYTVMDTLKDLIKYGRVGVPRLKVLKQLQKAKDDTGNGIGLRFALTAVLSWSERLLLAQADLEPVSPWAFWRWNTRLGRSAFVGQVLLCFFITLVLFVTSNGAPDAMAKIALGIVLLFGTCLRRLHDMGHGIVVMVLLALLSIVVPFLPLVLVAMPGDRLPNRYGVSPEHHDPRELSGGLQAVLRRLNS
ncbi:DUF805 domain-containing protein [Pseudomonas aegrilactucae]|uniref:DUF805 domain-containing protein n=1 Tax=Pseudomonas aegrilactucae TaxID=2854028 RepID=A0A9Q2XP81_9PSED|nr:DUF805 domain-containing protein [Pseudomonas aegrilactucae]MBV6289754.1 DUF805 domain-containing protein [Pseudomonas aegrilactucae]